MRHVLLLLLTTASYACAQTPQQLLQMAQDTYRSPEGYQINGRGSVQPLGSSWQINFDVKIAAAPSPPGDPQAPANSGSAAVGHLQFVNVLGGADEKPTSLSIPLALAGFWNRIAKNVDTVTETGSETLPLNGAPTSCRVLQVVYKAPADAPQPSPVTYSICSDRHLVLKKVMLLPTGRHATDPPVPWTITFDTAKFNRPAPEWLHDLKDFPTVTTRTEWLGRPAPDFKLLDLDGNSVALSSLQGKAVLLDFWSISCGPCIREMPMIESTAETHKKDLVVWGVSLDQPDRDKKWLLEHQRSLPTLSDVDYVASDVYQVHGIPAVVLIGVDGKVRNYWQGEVAGSDLETAIRQATSR
jgi:peroxiredoxin